MWGGVHVGEGMRSGRDALGEDVRVEYARKDVGCGKNIGKNIGKSITYEVVSE